VNQIDKTLTTPPCCVVFFFHGDCPLFDHDVFLLSKEKLERMRKQKEASEKRKADREKAANAAAANADGEGQQEKSGSSKGAARGGAGTNSFRQPPQSEDEASYRNFNKRFYEEFRKTVRLLAEVVIECL
jgi:hypothetical protein